MIIICATWRLSDAAQCRLAALAQHLERHLLRRQPLLHRSGAAHARLLDIAHRQLEDLETLRASCTPCTRVRIWLARATSLSLPPTAYRLLHHVHCRLERARDLV